MFQGKQTRNEISIHAISIIVMKRFAKRKKYPLRTAEFLAVGSVSHENICTDGNLLFNPTAGLPG
jgi:hypothetical protein